MKEMGARRTRVTSVGMRCGFTLIELLTTLTIVGVLAALTIAAVHNAHRRAKSANCQSNLRQVAIAVQSFVADNHVYPLYINPKFQLGEYPEHSTAWVRALAPHGANEVNLKCPSAPTPSHGEASRDVSVGYNAYGVGADVRANQGLGLGAMELVIDPAFAYHPVPEASVVTSSSMLMVGDAFLGWDQKVSDDTAVLWRNRSAERSVAQNPMSAQRAAKRHGKRANVSFCDGHVQTLTFKLLFRERGPAALGLWNRDGRGHEELLE